MKAYSYIRFSTDRQTWGDSERRQEKAAKDYCARKGIALAESFADRGVSGWKGKNRQSGAFAKLLTVVKDGDSILIEDNDRFSREDPITALVGLRDVVQKGISVVFLKTGVEVNRMNFNDANVLFPNFFQAYLGNQETVKKSHRISEGWSQKRSKTCKTWSQKRGKLKTEKMTSRCVGWLKPVHELTSDDQPKRICVGFKPIPQRVKVIKQIFQLAASGLGQNSIARRLNEQNVPTFGKMFGRASTAWSPSYIKKILNNKAVLGEFTPGTTRTENSKRKLLDPVPGYYPAIVTPELFATASKIRKARDAGILRQRPSQYNVFGGLAFDRATGSPMTYVNKSGKKSKGKRVWHYLVARDAMLGTVKGKYHSWQYDEFLSTFMFVCRGAIIAPHKQEARDGKLDLARMELDDTQKQIDRLIELHAKGISSSVETKLRECEDRKSKLKADIENLESESLVQPIDTKINWTAYKNDDELRANLRLTVKRITVDAESKSFNAELFDGRKFGIKIGDKVVSLTLPSKSGPATLKPSLQTFNEARKMDSIKAALKTISDKA